MGDRCSLCSAKGGHIPKSLLLSTFSEKTVSTASDLAAMCGGEYNYRNVPYINVEQFRGTFVCLLYLT